MICDVIDTTHDVIKSYRVCMARRTCPLIQLCTVVLVFQAFQSSSTRKKGKKNSSTFDPFRSKQVPLPEGLDDEVMRSLNEKHHNFTRRPGGVVELQCETKTVQRILRKFPRASYRWIHNGSPLKMDASRMRYQMGELAMSKLIPSDTGVFVCQIEYEPGQVKTVAVFSLFVKASKGNVIHVQQAKDVKLQCHSTILGSLFEGSRRSWKHNKKIVIDDIPAWNKSDEVFRNAHQNVTGNWTCTVHQPQTGRFWTTAFYTVMLDPPPTAMENTLSFFKTYAIYFVALGIGVVCFFVVILVALARHFEQKKRKNEEEMMMIAQRFLDQEEETEGSSDSSENGSTDDDEN